MHVFSMAIVLSLTFAGNAFAMEKPNGFPNRPITIIVPYGPGGGSDQVTRAISTPLEKVIGVPIKIVNVPGGAGTSGFADFWDAPSDGYTLFEITSDAITHYAAGVLKQNPTKDYLPLCIAQVAYFQIYIRPDEKRFQDWKGLVEYAKKNPKALTIALSGQEGNIENVILEILDQSAGMALTRVSFHKPAERYGALVGGHVDVLIESPGDVHAFLESGDMKPILNIVDGQPPAFAHVPNIKEFYPDYVPLYLFRTFYIKADAPSDRMKYLEWAFHEAWKTDSFQKFNKEQRLMENSYRGTEDAIKVIGANIKVYQKVYKELGLVK